MLFQSKRRITSIEKTKDVEYSVVAIGIYRYDTVIFALRQVVLLTQLYLPYGK